MTNVKYLFTFLTVIIPCFIFSQNIRHLSVDEGLPQSFVSAIVEGKNGFMWISTRNGLARYDGHKFKIFQSSANNKDALASNIIEYIQNGSDYSIWIKYENGEIDRFDIDTEQSTHTITQEFLEKHKIAINRRVWLVTTDNILWFKEKGGDLYTVDLKDKNRLVNQSQYLEPQDGSVYNLLEDRNKNLWLLTQKAIVKVDRRTNKFISIPIPEELGYNLTKKQDFSSFHCRSNGELMWTDGEKLYFFNQDKQTFRKVKLPLISKVPIRWVDTGPNGKDYFVCENKICSYNDDYGIEIITDIDLKGNRQPQAFLVDKSGLIWVGGDAEGVYTIDTDIDFEGFSYEDDFIVDVLKEVYNISVKDFFGWHYDKKGVLNPSYSFRSVWDNNKHWMALNRTVCYYDKDNGNIIKFPTVPQSHIKKFVPVVGVSIINNNPVVIDKANDIYLFNASENKWEHLLNISNTSGAGTKKITPNNIYADSYTNYLWITTESHGLIKVSIRTKKIVLIQSGKTDLPTNNLISVTPDIDNANILWIGSTGGLIRFDKTSYSAKVFSVKEGLPDNVIYSILTDSSGNFWMGTNKGLVYFNTYTDKCRVFTRNHGLHNIEFNHFHQLLLPDGKMAFGGISDGVMFYPDNIKEDTFSPQTAFTSIKLNNKTIRSLKPELRPVNNLEVLPLNYTENSITISYTALQFSQPLDINYRYRLVGYDDDWVEVGNKREAVYTKLPPGNYNFEVNASNTSGIWSPHIRSLEIQITPPWWQTWWAKLLYLIIGVVSIAWFIRFRINQGVIKNQILLKQKEAKELRKLDQVKTRFFSNIAHEFRTPLSLILGPANQLRGINDEDGKEKLLDIIEKNTSSLINLTDQLLDIAKLEAGVLKPQMVWGDVVMVASNIINAFREEATAKQVTIKFDAPATAEFLFSINTLDRILYNLISNALKFCDAGDVITIKISKNKEGLFLEVKDTGKGIPDEEQKNIFNRYFKGSNQAEQQGNGIGLSLVGELVDLHKGTITLNSSTQLPTGTTFSVWLPLDSKKEEVVLKYKKEDEFEADELIQDKDNNTKPVVLVVEDYEELASFIIDNLKDNYKVLYAANGEDALDVVLKKSPDLIVSDVAMEKMNGFEFCRAVKQDITINHIPIILLTAKADMDSRLEGLSFGANDYLTKPFSVSELQLRIKNQLKLQNKQREHYHKSFISSSEEESVNNNEAMHTTFLEEIYKIVDNNLDDKNFSVDELASALCMSRTSLHRKVKTMFDIPAGEIIKVYRLKKAAKLLSEDYNASEVAYMTGFNTPSYFSKCFKEYYGVTPAKYNEK